VTVFAGLCAAEQHELDGIGRRWEKDIQGHRDRVLSIYRPHLARAPRAGIEVTRDIAYGPHPRQVFDLYRREGIRDAPVVIFVHGGAFIRGAKDVDGEVYANVLYYFARHGCLGVNAEYRLAPVIVHPQGAADVASVVAWTIANAGRFGGDPQRIHVIGHSAGATHVATYACDPAARPPGGHGLAGVVLLSGRLRADARPENPNAAGVRAYFGDDEARYDALSPVSHAANLDVPLLMAAAQYENPLLDVYCAEFLHRVAAARGRSPRFLQLWRHNHFSMAAHFNTAEDDLGREILEFIGAC